MACKFELKKELSRNAIKRFFVSENEAIGYIFELLSKRYVPELEWKIIVKIAEKVIGLPLDAPEGKWKLGATIKILSTYTLYGFKKNEIELAEES